jgi:hypothetical protein
VYPAHAGTALDSTRRVISFTRRFRGPEEETLFRRIFGRRSGDTPGGNPFPEGRAEPLLSQQEIEKIGTEDDPLLDYEAGLERNFAAMAAERRGDVSGAVALYETNVTNRFVGSYPYERLATIYEARNAPGEAIRVLTAFVRLARSDTLPRGAQRSADRKLPQIEARLRSLEASGRGEG